MSIVQYNLKGKGFFLGNLEASEEALAKLPQRSMIEDALTRYMSQDWGHIDLMDALSNSEAARTGKGRIFAIYKTQEMMTFYIVTDFSKHRTRILMPGERI